MKSAETFGNDFRPDQNISEIRKLDYLIKEYPNENLIPQFIKLRETYPCYRAIKGDGNCFYRAVAFLYLREGDLSEFSNVFEKIENFCIDHRLEFETITFIQKLEGLYNEKIFPLRNTEGENREEELIKCFNDSLVFDHMMVMYFRSLNYKYIREHESEFIHFVESKKDIDKVRKFGNESEGIEYQSMAQALNVEICMRITNENQQKSEIYNKNGLIKSFDIFFRPGHFDLLYHKNSQYLRRFFEQEKNSQNQRAVFENFDNNGHLQNKNTFKNFMTQKPKAFFPNFFSSRNPERAEEKKEKLAKETTNEFFKSRLTPLRNHNKIQPLKQEKPMIPEKKPEETKNIFSNLLDKTNLPKNKTVETEKLPEKKEERLDDREQSEKIKEVVVIVSFLIGLGYIFLNF